MENKNGWMARTLIGFLFVILVTKSTNVIANDRASRQRDVDIQKEAVVSERRLSETLDDIKSEQNEKFTKILITLERLKTTIEKNGRKN